LEGEGTEPSLARTRAGKIMNRKKKRKNNHDPEFNMR